MIIGIIGSGAMGAGIAQVVATAGHPVRLLDQNATALEKAQAGIAASLLHRTGRSVVHVDDGWERVEELAIPTVAGLAA